MQDQSFFSELDLVNLKTQAIVWFNKFQCIQEIFLYKAGGDLSDWIRKYILVFVAPPMPKLSQKEESIRDLAYSDIVTQYGFDRLEEALNNIKNPELRFKACTMSFQNAGRSYISDKLRNGVYKEFYKDLSDANIEDWFVVTINNDPHCSFNGPETILDIIDSKVKRVALFRSPAILEQRLMEKAKGLSDIGGFVKKGAATGYIAKERLAHVLGYDDQYNLTKIRELWVEYALEGETKPKEDSEREKIEAWYYILRRLTTGADYRGVNHSRLSVLPLNQYAYVQRKLSYVKVDPDDETGSFIKLADLKRYFPEMLGLPLPQKLYPQEFEESIATSSDLRTGIWISKTETLKWEDISIWAVNDFEIGFHPKGETAIIRKFFDIGFGDKRKNNSIQIKSWDDLIQAIKNRGEIPYTKGPDGTRTTIEKTAQILRQKLKKLFPRTEGDPVPLDKKNSTYRLALTVK